MKRYEITYQTTNGTQGTKPITALVIEPDQIGTDTGVMLATHGWGPNRFQHEHRLHVAANEYDLVGLAVEYRQSGYDCDPVTGNGWDCPYDASFYQTLDVLNGLRFLLDLHPQLNRSRLIHYGGSQGGHIALLGAVFAPNTFAGIYANVPAALIDEKIAGWAGRTFAPHELAIRNVLNLCDRIQCPVLVEHGTLDTDLPYERHAGPLVKRLKEVGKLDREVAYAGGHDLTPAITRHEAFLKSAPLVLRQWRNPRTDDFRAKNIIEVPAADYILRIDWSKPLADPATFTWVKA